MNGVNVIGPFVLLLVGHLPDGLFSWVTPITLEKPKKQHNVARSSAEA